jgi:4-hydroxy-2-oxoheptanedioate aldolase
MFSRLTSKVIRNNFSSLFKRSLSDICDIRDRGHLFKQDLKNGKPKMGLFLNSGSPVVAEQLSHSGYDWLLVDFQHGPMDYTTLASMLSSIANGKALSLVRVGGYHDRIGIQQSLDSGSNGILIPYVNNGKEAKEAVNSCLYPTKGSRSVYFPQRSTNVSGLLGYVGNFNKNAVVAIQIETKDSIDNIDEIVGTEGLDIAFLGQNDLCLSMGLFEKYEFPHMYSSPELKAAVKKLLEACKKHKKIPGIFLFGTDKVGESIEQGFNLISVGNDLHGLLLQTGTHVKNLEEITKKHSKNPWTRQHSSLI